MITGIPSELLEGRHVFWETAPTESRPRPQELRADAGVQPHPARDFLDVRPELLRDVCDLVDERDLGRQKRVRCQLDHLSRGDLGAHHRGVERLVERLNAVAEGGVAVARSDHHAIRVLEVGDRRALLQELGVRDIAHLLQPALDRAAGADRDRRLHDERVRVEVADLLDHLHHARQVGVARIHGRGVDAAEEELGVVDDVAHVERPVQALGVSLDQLGQAGLVDRHVAARQRVDLFLHDVADPDVMSEVGEASCGDEAYPARPDYPEGLTISHRRPRA